MENIYIFSWSPTYLTIRTGIENVFTKKEGMYMSRKIEAHVVNRFDLRIMVSQELNVSIHYTPYRSKPITV